MQKVKKGDQVMVMSGNAKGGRGEVEKVVYDRAGNATHVVVSGLNMRTKHARPNPAKGEPGGRKSKEAPIHISNVALYNEEKGGPDRVRVKVADDGKRVRVFASGGNID